MTEWYVRMYWCPGSTSMLWAHVYGTNFFPWWSLYTTWSISNVYCWSVLQILIKYALSVPYISDQKYTTHFWWNCLREMVCVRNALTVYYEPMVYKWDKTYTYRVHLVHHSNIQVLLLIESQKSAPFWSLSVNKLRLFSFILGFWEIWVWFDIRVHCLALFVCGQRTPHTCYNLVSGSVISRYF